MQQYRSSRRTGVPLVACPDTVLIRNSPLSYGERLNRDLGIYIQDSWRLNRLTANVGIRWETLNASGAWPASRRPAASCRSARSTKIKDVPDWNDFAPRMGLVYDLFGNGKTALKYSLNRYNLSRTTGIAANYNPLLSQTATLPWRRQEPQRRRRRLAALRLHRAPTAKSTSPACRPTTASPR